MTQCAWGASRKKEGYFRQKYHRLVVRKGSKKAIVAVSHKLIIAAYHVLNKKQAYISPLLNDNIHTQKTKAKAVQKHLAQLSKLGFSVRLTPID